MRKRHFTLMELMAAMAVLVIMMGFLFKFITASQDLWSASDRNARIYENSRVFFELLQRDLSTAVASDTLGEEIGFWIAPCAGNSAADFLAFVSQSPSAGAAGSDANLWEIHYRWGDENEPQGVRYLIRRAAIGNRDDGSSGTTAAYVQWDFYGDTTTTTPPTWVSTVDAVSPADDPWQEVIDGVEKLDVAYVDDSGTGTWTSPSHKHELPKAVKVSLTLIDQSIVDLNLPADIEKKRLDASRRTFTKVIFLGR
jgi:type II secretory pathway component PulJ